MFSQVKELVCNIAMLEKDRFYLASIDNIVFDGPEQVVSGGEIKAVYDSRNDSLPDSDGDGIADRYENGTGIFVSATETGSDPDDPDSDDDGQPDGAEVVAGTDPNSSADYFHLGGVSLDAGGDLVVIWDGRAGRSYDLEFYDPDGSGDCTLYFNPRLGVAPVHVTSDGPAEARIPIPAGVRSILVRARARMTGN